MQQGWRRKRRERGGGGRGSPVVTLPASLAKILMAGRCKLLKMQAAQLNVISNILLLKRNILDILSKPSAFSLPSSLPSYKLNTASSASSLAARAYLYILIIV